MNVDSKNFRRSGQLKKKKTGTWHKAVEWAYPSSTHATQAGYGRAGCWVVTLTNHEVVGSGRVLKAFAKSEAGQAVLFAATLQEPWCRHYLNHLDILRWVGKLGHEFVVVEPCADPLYQGWRCCSESAQREHALPLQPGQRLFQHIRQHEWKDITP